MSSTIRTLVSVVIPCFNQRRYLPDAIKSATSSDFSTEVIVVDHGSSEAGMEPVDSEFPAARCIRQPNGGTAAARNRGLEAACGDFVIFLDAADRLLPGAVDAAARALGSRPDCAMAYGRCVLMGPDGTIWPTGEPASVRSGHHAALLRTNLIWAGAMAILRRDRLVEAGGFALGFDAAADYDLYLRLTSRYAACDHGQLVAASRCHSESMRRDASRMLRETLAVMRRNFPCDPHLRSAWLEGYRNWQEFYGAQLVDEIRDHVHAREPWPALKKALTLARMAPPVFARELAEKTRLTLQPRLGSGL